MLLLFDCTLPLLGLVPALQGVWLLAHGDCALPLPFGDSLCGVAGVAVTPVELLGTALSWVLDGVAGVDGVVDGFVVVVVCVVVLGVLVVVVLLVGLDVVVVLCVLWLAVSLLVLWASASVPVRSRPAARIESCFMGTPSDFEW